MKVFISLTNICQHYYSCNVNEMYNKQNSLLVTKEKIGTLFAIWVCKKSSNVLVNAVKLYFYNFCFFHTIIFTWITYIRWILQNTIIVNYDFSYLQTDLKDLEIVRSNLKTLKVLIQQINIGQTFPQYLFNLKKGEFYWLWN